MRLSHFFVEGGFGMYPTLLAGLCLLATCVLYALRPKRRYVPLMAALGLFTLLAGGLGFVTGVSSMLEGYTGDMAHLGPIVLFAGLRESLNNLVLALMLSALAALFASLGAWRLSRRLTPEPALAR
jgi:uncharacterized membrane protein YqjE